MYTSVGLLTLASLFAGPVPEELVWSSDYYSAQEQGQREKKPLAVVVGSGAVGYDKLTREGSLNENLKKLLASHYLCVYLDSSSDANRDLVSKLAIAKGQGIVVSDRTANRQAFRHDGPIAASDLARTLERVAGGTRRVSYYPADSSMTSNGSSGNGSRPARVSFGRNC